MNYTDEQNKGNNSGMYGQTEGMRSEQENRSDSDRMKAGERNRQDEVGYDKTRGDETAWKSGEGLSDKVERKLEKAEKKIEKAEKKVEKAGEKFAKGFVNDGERKLEKAEKKIEKAEKKLNEVPDGINRNIDRAKEQINRTAENMEHNIRTADRNNMGTGMSHDSQKDMKR